MTQDSQDVKPTQEYLKKLWAQRGYGALAKICDKIPAVLPVGDILAIPPQLVQRRQALDIEKRAIEAEGANARDKMPAIQELVDKAVRTIAEEATIREFNEEIAKTLARKAKNTADEARLQRQEERYEDKLTDAAVALEAARAPMRIAMVQDILKELDDSLESRVKAHARFAEAYDKNDPAALWNIVTTVITGGVKLDPQEAMLRAEASAAKLSQGQNESLEKYFDRARSLRSTVNATREACLGSEYDADIMDPESLWVRRILKGLRREYTPMVADLENSKLTGESMMPETIQQSYQGQVSAHRWGPYAPRDVE